MLLHWGMQGLLLTSMKNENFFRNCFDFSLFGLFFRQIMINYNLELVVLETSSCFYCLKFKYLQSVFLSACMFNLDFTI